MADIFTPIKIGAHTIKNRVFMASMHTGLEGNIEHIPSWFDFLELRAKGGAGLIVTGGISPNPQGVLKAGGAYVTEPWMAAQTAHIKKIQTHDCQLILQLLHAGRYSMQPECVAPSAIQAPISVFTPQAMSDKSIENTINDYINSARLAQKYGYNGIELMASEGYLINQFLTTATNQREDQWGGNIAKRSRLLKRLIVGIRAQCGSEFMIFVRLSLQDFIEDENTLDDIVYVVKHLKTWGADALVSGFGWHESTVPTIAYMVPRDAFHERFKQVKKVCDLPLIATNRIPDKTTANDLIVQNMADAVALARPWLADADWLQKYQQQKTPRPCIACNQYCLDRVFEGKSVQCVVNPHIYQNEIFYKTNSQQKIAVIGAGVAGLESARVLAERGLKVTVFEKNADIGGQLALAASIPDKQEYQGLIDWYQYELERLGVQFHLNLKVNAKALDAYEHVVLATGVVASNHYVEGDQTRQFDYHDLLSGQLNELGRHVAIIGGGGIAIDTAFYLQKHYPKIQVYLVQRSSSPVGKKLGKTTAWIHRMQLFKNNVTVVCDAHCQQFQDQNLELIVEGVEQHLTVDSLVLCTGQMPNPVDFESDLKDSGKNVLSVGGVVNSEGLNIGQSLHHANKLCSHWLIDE